MTALKCRIEKLEGRIRPGTVLIALAEARVFIESQKREIVRLTNKR